MEQIYAEHVRRKLDSTISLPLTPPATIQFRNENSLTRQETIYALNTVLNLAGIQIVSNQDGSIRSVPLLKSKQ